MYLYVYIHFHVYICNDMWNKIYAFIWSVHTSNGIFINMSILVPFGHIWSGYKHFGRLIWLYGCQEWRFFTGWSSPCHNTLVQFLRADFIFIPEINLWVIWVLQRYDCGSCWSCVQENWGAGRQPTVCWWFWDPDSVWWPWTALYVNHWVHWEKMMLSHCHYCLW